MMAGLLVAVVNVNTSGAQTPTLPVHVVGPCALPPLKAGEKPTTALTQSFLAGHWKQFKANVDEVLAGMGSRPDLTPGCALPGPAPDYVLVGWIGQTALGEPALLTAIVGRGPGESYSSRLPGVAAGSGSTFYQLFVSDGEDDALAAGYVSTPVEDPLLAQVPDVAAETLGPMLSLIGANMSRQLRAAVRPVSKAPGTLPPPPAAGWATASRVDLPHERARVKVELKATLAPTSAGLVRASAKLRDTLSMLDVRYSKPARDFATALDAIVQGKAQDCVEPEANCLAVLDAAFKAEFEATCPCPDDDRKAVQLVDARFRKLAAEVEGHELDAKSELQNVPMKRFSFGIMTGLSFGRWSNVPRVEVDDGVYAHDPLDRQLTMVTFNGAFRPYDAKAFRMTRAERHRWFVGAAIMPTFGVGAGYSFLPLRGLGINAGYALLGISTPAGGKAVGEAPPNEDDPFELGVAGTAFLGLSYNFK
jgi:hypothetical protein